MILFGVLWALFLLFIAHDLFERGWTFFGWFALFCSAWEMAMALSKVF
jgi:hypothetical protein